MKILEFIPTLGPGGGQSLVVDLCNELAETEDITLVTLRDDTLKYYGFMAKDLSVKVKHKSLKLPENSNWKTMLGIYKAIKEEKPDIIHFHMCISFALFAICCLGWRYPIVQTIHNDIKSSYSKTSYKLIIRLTGWLHLCRYVTICDTNSQDFKKAYPGIFNRMIYNGRKPLVQTEKYPMVKKEIEGYKMNEQTKVYLHVARCNPQKNQRLLIEVFNVLIAGGANAILLIIGFRNEVPEEKYLKKIASHTILFLGTKSNVIDYLLNADCFILSSVFEGMPITIIEALNCGVPVVSTPVSGVVDVVKSGENGYVSENHTLEAFKEAVELSYKNISIIQNNTKSAIKDSPLTIKRCASEYLKLFKEIK